eukprot:TRINITY_DN7156_c0_g1_i18.p1 TRINITY_DN7156_c0_g1~~TRINITY_DN7156_c0_g1_i18.p1  ORF type:complete len:326 (+),score=14.68 TRINITY_DN7156_c0_g1_i18:90-1067(+)
MEFNIYGCLRAGFLLSAVSSTLFIGAVFLKGLVQTMLMRLVVCLAISDLMVVFWELLDCNSVVNRPGKFCIHGPCSLGEPFYRTFQMASFMWTTLISIFIFVVLSGRSQTCFQYTCYFWILAPLLSVVHWVGGGRQSHGWCAPVYMWALDVQLMEYALCVIICLWCYLHALYLSWKSSTGAVMRRIMHRCMLYVIFFLVTWGPYVLLNMFGKRGRTMEYILETGPNALRNRMIYLLYSLSGTCNVIAYGIHHWDTTCCRRVDDEAIELRQVRVVRFSECVTTHDIAFRPELALSSSFDAFPSASPPISTGTSALVLPPHSSSSGS